MLSGVPSGCRGWQAFIGRSLERAGDHESLRMCLVGAHFPISQLAAALEESEKEPLEQAKLAMGKTLRTVGGLLMAFRSGREALK